MERTKNKISGLILFLLFPMFVANAQQKNMEYYQCAFFESYRHGNMAVWPGLIAEMERVKSPDLNWQIEMVKAMYGLVGYQLGVKDKESAKKYVNTADQYLEQLLEKHPGNAKLHSLNGAFYGYKIALAFYKAPFYGPKSMYSIDKSISLDPAEPMGYIEKGNSLLYRPAAFGGNKEEALVLYRKAFRLMEAGKSQKCNWQRLLLQAFILKTLYETNRDTEANRLLQEMKNDYGSMDWVKDFVGSEVFDKK